MTCSANDTTPDLLHLDPYSPFRLPPSLIPLPPLLLPLHLLLRRSDLEPLGEIDLIAGAFPVLLPPTQQPGQPVLDLVQRRALDLAALARGDQMLARVQVVDELEVVLEGQVALGAVEARAPAPLPQRRARRHQAGFAHIGADVEPRGA